MARGEDLIGDIDILAVGISDETVREAMGGNTHGKNPIRKTIEGVLVEVWICPLELRGAYSLYLDGPLSRNVRMRRRAHGLGMRWRRDGLYSGDGSLLTTDPDEILRLIG